ncbi:MAG TPA: mannosyltransferase family protein [Candidatus Saccharimonadales bacterium]|nr:mannosyltransferase family protein [Candidatus Saccharimonadales bacterium]
MNTPNRHITYPPVVKDRWQKISHTISSNELLLALVTVVVLVIVGVTLGWINNKIVLPSAVHASHYHLEPHNPLRYMANHDGPIYIHIAENGYQKIHLTNYFPVYPLLIRAFHKVIPSALDSALIISWACLVGAVYYYLKIVKELFNVKNNLEALRAVLFFILFPTAIFLIATYTESLFAFVSLAAIYYALKKQYLPAMAFSFLSTAAHDNGVLTLILVCLILYEKKERLIHIFWTLVIGGLGLVTYMVYLYEKFHKPLAFITAQKSQGWAQQGGNIIDHLADHSHLSNYFFWALVIIAAYYWWSRRRNWAIYSILYAVIPLAGGIFGGYNRYILMAFPVPLMFYDKFRKSPTGYQIVLTLSVILWTLISLQYMGGYIGS